MGAEYFISRLSEINRWRILARIGEDRKLVVETWKRQQVLEWDLDIRKARAGNELVAVGDLTRLATATVQNDENDKSRNEHEHARWIRRMALAFTHHLVVYDEQ